MFTVIRAIRALGFWGLFTLFLIYIFVGKGVLLLLGNSLAGGIIANVVGAAAVVAYLAYWRRRSRLEFTPGSNLAKRRDEKVLLELLEQFDELKRAGWQDMNALSVVFDLAYRFDASPSVRAELCNYTPIKKAIESNPSSPLVRSFMGDPELTFQLPGR